MPWGFKDTEHNTGALLRRALQVAMGVLLVRKAVVRAVACAWLFQASVLCVTRL